MSGFLRRIRGLKLQYLLFFLLMVTGIIPLAISSTVLILMNRDLLTTQEKSFLTQSAENLSESLDDRFGNTRSQLTLLGEALLAGSSGESFEERLRQPWVAPFLERALRSNPDLLALRVLNLDGAGPRFGAARLPGQVTLALAASFSLALDEGRPVYQLVATSEDNRPLAVTAVPIRGPEGAVELVVEGVLRLAPTSLVRRDAAGQLGLFLIDRNGDLLWSEGADLDMQVAVVGSELVQDFAMRPLSMTREYELSLTDGTQRMQGMVSPVPETGWGVVVQKPLAQAYAAVRRMIWNAVLSTGLLLALSLLAAVVAARRATRPIQNLADKSHEIVEGNFGQRVEDIGFGREIQSLAVDFNRMSEHVEKYIADLQEAARANRELFIGSIRAFAAAIDAKDPYTLGHSERVAQYSRTTSRYLGLPDDFEQRLWIGALLHDVGKIGIEDRILQKVGALTDEEYDVMKLHPVIGEEILSSIEQLADSLPAIRSHHEAWNGTGYPDGISADRIPLMARIVMVADTFDAVTTHRPYQKGYSPEYAVKTITELAGTRFDAKVVTAFLRAFEDGEISDPRQSSGETPTAATAVVSMGSPRA